MAASSERAFENNFSTYDKEEFSYYDISGNSFNISRGFQKKLIKAINHLLERHEKEYEYDWKDPSVYTGTSGVALMYLHLYNSYGGIGSRPRSAYLEKATSIMKKTIKNLRHRAISFLGGDAGPLAVGAIVFKYSNLQEEYEECVKNLLELVSKIESDSPEPDEFLFGKSGLLYSLLFVNKAIGWEVISQEKIDKLARIILKSGKELARDTSLACPLMYEWHAKKYLGAAHGISGILYVLLNLVDVSYVSRHLDSHIQPTVDYLISLQFPSGNFPSSVSRVPDDRLVQWCHGSPGFIFMLLLAHKVLDYDVYMEAAKKGSKDIWKRGLLKKGYGLCHGVAGNAYAFLAMFNATKKSKYLYQACKFTEWCMDYDKHGCRTPDRPYSLFEGMAGTIYFLVDMLNPIEAKFPAFEI